MSILAKLKQDTWQRRLFYVSLAQFLATCGFGFSLPFIPFFIKEHLCINDEAQRSMWVGLFSASGQFALFIFSPIWGFVADIYGRRKMLLRAYLASAIIMPLMIFVPGPGWLVTLRFLIGAFAGTVTASQALIASTTPQKRMGFAMGVVVSAVGSGNLTGMLMGSLIVDSLGYAAGFTASGALLLVAAFLIMHGATDPFVQSATLMEKIRVTHFGLPKFGGLWFLLSLMAVTGFVTYFERPFIPQLVEQVTVGVRSKFWVGIVLSCSALAGIVAGSVMGRLADRFSPPKVGFVSSLLAGLATLPVGFSTSIPMLVGFRTCMAFFMAGLDPVFQIWLAKSVPAEKRALFLGWGTSFRAMGWFVSSAAAGTVAMLLGVRSVFFVAACLFIALLPLIRMASRRITIQKI